MPAGLEIINTSGTVLIDENYQNLAVRAKGTVGISSAALKRATVAMSGVSSPMIALASASAFSGIKNVLSDLSQFTIQGEAPPASNVDYFIFDVPLASGLSHGLQVFNTAGTLVFDAGNKYARVVDVYGGPNTSDWTPSRTYAAGRTYAVVQLKRAYRKQVVAVGGGGGFDVTWYMSGSRVVSNVVTGKMIIYKEQNVASAPAAVNDNSAMFAVIDVTGY